MHFTRVRAIQRLILKGRTFKRSLLPSVAVGFALGILLLLAFSGERLWGRNEIPESVTGTIASPTGQPDSTGAVESKLLDQIGPCLAKLNMKFSQLDDETLAGTMVCGSRQWNAYLATDERRRVITLFSCCPEKVPQERRNEAARFMAKVNWGLMLGHFTMDFSDGEVRFKTSIPIGQGMLDQAAFARVLNSNFSTFDHYLPELYRIIGEPIRQEDTSKEGLCHQDSQVASPAVLVSASSQVSRSR